MGQIEKLIERFRRHPSDFEYEELKKLLSSFGYEEFTKGKTSGSRVIFIRSSDKASIMLHKPHPSNILKTYQIIQIYDLLVERGDIDE